MRDGTEFPPIHHHLGGHELQWDAEQRVMQIKYKLRDCFLNPRGHIEGGMLCAILDDTMGILATLNHNAKPATTVNLTMDFFRPCQVGVVSTKAWFSKEGNRILNMESEAWQHNKLIAKCHAAFLVL